MTKGFWEKLHREKLAKGEPIFALAPLANVTDAAFRRITAKYGKPDVMWTEFVSADGLFLGGAKVLMRDLEFTKAERPIVAQFFTSKPEMMEKAAKLAVKLGFDGIDINMGCPDRTIEKQGAGAAHIKNPKLAREIIRAAQSGAGDLPVSVKTRIGYNKNQLAEWLSELLAENPAVVTIHARTRKEMSKISARWVDVGEAVKIRDNLKSETLILGNGDVVDLVDARKKAKEYRADGVMLGRAIFGNPWLFAGGKRSDLKEPTTPLHSQVFKDVEEPILEAKLRVMVEHTKLFEKLLGDIKSFAIMKKHFKAYVDGFAGAKELRMKLMETEKASEVERIVQEYLNEEKRT